MNMIKTVIRVSDDRTITGITPAEIPAGEHEVIVTLSDIPKYRVADLPVHTSLWDDTMSLRREDIYADDGR